jgi:hypothetical protein
MLLFSNTAEYGITWDRMDGCANALISLIALDSQRFVWFEYLYVRIYRTVLHCIVVYCTILKCPNTALYCSALYCTAHTTTQIAY